MHDATATILDRPHGPDAQLSDFEQWCGCVRRLLGWRSGEMADWPELFASGHTPRDAARFAIYGDGLGD